MRCLDENQLAGLADGSLRSEERAAAEKHLDNCRDCRQMLAALARALPGRGSSDDLGLPPTVIANKLPRLPELGERLAGRFLLEALLGYGAMGVVYKARDEALDLEVALKVLRPDLADKSDLLKQIRREVQLGRRINHPNACRLFDFGSHEGIFFLIQELIAGESLQALAERKAVAPTAAGAVVEQICAGLAAAHREGIVHRDLKPANVMVEPAGRAVIMDFGLAADVMRELSVQGPVGTPAFWAPEQARGERATPASDVWSLGAIATLLFTGQRVAGHSPPDLTEVPPGFREFLRGCLQVDPARRFASAVEALEALRRSTATQLERRPPLRRLFALVASVTFAAVFGGGMALKLLEKRGDPGLELLDQALQQDGQVGAAQRELERLSAVRADPPAPAREALRKARALIGSGRPAEAWSELRKAEALLQ